MGHEWNLKNRQGTAGYCSFTVLWPKKRKRPETHCLERPEIASHVPLELEKSGLQTQGTISRTPEPSNTKVTRHLQKKAVLTHWDQVPEVLHHHILVQLPLGRVQQPQLLLCEGHSHVLEGHCLLQQTILAQSYSQCPMEERQHQEGEEEDKKSLWLLCNV